MLKPNGNATKIPGLTHYNAKTIIHETLHAYMLMQLDRMRIERQYNDIAEKANTFISKYSSRAKQRC